MRRLMMMDKNDNASTGFSGRSDLGTVIRRQNEHSKAVALRVSAATDMEYLRGAVFDRFDGFAWQNTEKIRRIVEAKNLAAADEAGSNSEPDEFVLLKTGEAGTGDLQKLTIWPGDVPPEILFTPLNTVSVEVTATLLTFSQEAVIHASGHPSRVPWDIRRQTGPVLTAFSEYDHNRLTELPPALAQSPQLNELVRRITAGAGTVPEKVAAVTRYLQQNHRYSDSVAPPAGADPLLWFLMNGEAAHCEYFATAATVLLRQAGVPVRYVTGFVAAEKNPLTGEWIARNRDAHAWAEAWDAESGWMIVEATPADGQPRQLESGWLRSLYEGLKSWWQRLQAAVQQEGAVAAVLMLFVGWWEYVASSMFVVALILAGRQTWQNRRQARSSVVVEEPLIGELHQQLSQMDRAAGQAGYERSAEETLHEFSQRLKAAASQSDRNAGQLTQMAAWYHSYAAVRYGGRREEASVTRLAALLLQSLAVPVTDSSAVTETGGR
ncbi:MAG: DUF3488 domain-containing protein [Planctomycetaceae bacterium]|nr:DUF3488 domain-containing protein [Planctomycetaceae bacterium]